MVDSEKILSPETDPEKSTRSEALKSLASEYLDLDDAVFLDEIDDEAEQIGYVYGRLLEQGEAPEDVLKEFGIIEDGESND